MQQYKLYTLSLNASELKLAQKHLLQYSPKSLLEVRALADKDSKLSHAEATFAQGLDERLCAHIPSEKVFSLSEGMKLEFATSSKSKPYSLSEGMADTNLSAIDYKKLKDGVKVNASVELELNRFSDDNNASGSSYMFVEATVKNTVLPYSELGAKLKELFGNKNYYVYEDKGSIVIKSDAEGTKAIMAKEYGMLAQLGLADKFAPTILQHKLLDSYVLQDDAEKTITVKLADKEVMVALRKDAAGDWQVYMPEVVLGSLKVAVPMLDDKGAELFLKQRYQDGFFRKVSATHPAEVVTALDVYALRSAKFQTVFDVEVFKAYAKQQEKCELLPAWAELIASDRVKYKAVLDHYLYKFGQGLLENPLYFVSFMQYHNIPFSYNDNSLGLMFAALQKKSQNKLYGDNPQINKELASAEALQQSLLKEHDSAAIVFARNLAKLNRAKAAASEQHSKEPFFEHAPKIKIVLRSPATIIGRAGKRFVKRNRQTPAARKLQTFIRSKVARISYLRTIGDIATAQAAVRRWSSKRKAAKMQKSILKMQTFMRMHLAMETYGKPKKVMPKPFVSKKVLTKAMRARIATNEAEVYVVVNDYFASQYELYANAVLSAVKNGETQNIAIAFGRFSENITSLHKELEGVAPPETATKLIAGQEQILTKTGKMNEIMHAVCAAKNDLYAKYIVAVMQGEDAANKSFMGALEDMYQKYRGDFQQLNRNLLTDTTSSLFPSSSAETQAEATTINAVLESVIALAKGVDANLHSLPKSSQDLDIYEKSIRTSAQDFEKGAIKANEDYKGDLSRGLKRAEAMARFHRSVKEQREKMQFELSVATTTHAEHALRVMMRAHKELSLQPMPASDNYMMQMAARIIQRKTRSFFKTSKHKKRMAGLYRDDFKAARLDFALKVQAAARMFLESNRYLKLKDAAQSQIVPALQEDTKKQPASHSPRLSLKTMVGISSSSASSARSSFDSARSSFDSASRAGDKIVSALRLQGEKAQKLMRNMGVIKPDNRQEESRRHGLAVLAAHAIMQQDQEPAAELKGEEPAPIKPVYVEKALDPRQKDFLAKANMSHLKSITEELAAKVQADVTLLEAAVVASPKDKKAIAKLRYLYTRSGDKDFLADSVVIAKARLALIGRELLSKGSESAIAEASVIAVARRLAVEIADIPVEQMSINQAGNVSFNGGYAWPRLLKKLGHKKTGLLQVATTTAEREIWFASICGIIEQPSSLTPTITTNSKREEVAFIDNAVKQLVVAMSKGLIKEPSLLLRGLETALYQINHSGYKHRVFKTDGAQDILGLLKSFNLALDGFGHEVLVKNRKDLSSSHDKDFIAKKYSLEKTFIELLELFKVFDKDSNAYKNPSISSEWLAIVGKIHFLAYDNSFVASNGIGFSDRFLDHHKACICAQKGGSHPVRSILAKSKVSHVFDLGTEQVKLTAGEMLELGEVALNKNKISSSLEFNMTNSSRVALVRRPYNSRLMHAMLFICTSATVVLLGLLPTLLSGYLSYAVPAIVLLGSMAYKLADMIDKEVVTGSFDVANSNLIEGNVPLSAKAISSQSLGVFINDDNKPEEEFEVSLTPDGPR